MNSIDRRVSKLEVAGGIGKVPWHVVKCICEPGESHEAAVERYRREHPETPDYTSFVTIRFVRPGTLEEP
jgi:hypothetical protein